ncbi:MAG: hypothetical protein IIT65_13040, partial [Lachnospiraceae bacterium]|nr:hypothetical protein [Lachnospiraceae bacterium]
MSEELKRRVYEILEPSTVKDPASKAYDFLMTLAVIVGLIPMMLKHENSFVIWIDVLTSLLFMIDYGFRLYTADYKMGYKSYKAYFAYVVSPMAIFDLLSIIPVVSVFWKISSAFTLLRLCDLQEGRSHAGCILCGQATVGRPHLDEVFTP